MKITANVQNSFERHYVAVSTNDNKKEIKISSKESGFGSAINGGEFLFLALATCFCNDLYREAAKRNINVKEVQVTVSGNFGAEGEPASGITYTAQVSADASEKQIADLIRDTDKVAEIQNTLRKGVQISLQA